MNVPAYFQKLVARLMLPVWLIVVPAVWANIPGGGTGTGAAVTLTDNGNGTVTIANGIVSIVFTKTGAQINNIYYPIFPK